MSSASGSGRADALVYKSGSIAIFAAVCSTPRIGGQKSPCCLSVVSVLADAPSIVLVDNRADSRGGRVRLGIALVELQRREVARVVVEQDRQGDQPM